MAGAMNDAVFPAVVAIDAPVTRIITAEMTTAFFLRMIIIFFCTPTVCAPSRAPRENRTV